MESLRQVAAVAVAVALSGCAATDRLSAHYLDAKRAVGLDPAAARPATRLSLIMQRRLASLPDPVRPDAVQPGLPGQVFLAGADDRPVPAGGDLTITVTDDTPRPPGQAPRTGEKWQFSRDVLAMLKQKDERFGECYVLFLPWPADWKDVTRVTIKGHYQAAGQVALFAQEVKINLDAGPAPGSGDLWPKAEQQPVPAIGSKPAVVGPPPTQPEPILLPPPALQPQSAAPGIVVPQTPAPAGPLVPQTIEIRRS